MKMPLPAAFFLGIASPSRGWAVHVAPIDAACPFHAGTLETFLALQWRRKRRKTMTKRILLLLVLTVAPALAHACPDLLNHRYTSLQGKPVNLCEFAGRPI